MKLIVCAALLVGSFTFIYPQCTTDQWEGVRETTIDYAHLRKRDHGIYEEYAVVHYDYKNKRTSVQMSTNDAGKIKLYNILIVYKDGEGVKYTSRYYPFKPCFKENLTKPFEEKCVPDGSTPAGNYFLGGPQDFQVKSLIGYTEDLTTKYVFTERDEKTMVPVLELVKGKLGQYDIYRTAVFKNITDGIKDEKVFNIPFGCMEGESDLLWSTEDEFPPREHSIFVV